MKVNFLPASPVLPMHNQRRQFTAEFKAKVALQALKEQKTLTQLADEYELHPTQITEWKKQAQQPMGACLWKPNGEKQEKPQKTSLKSCMLKLGN
jgi:transposase-like protein